EITPNHRNTIELLEGNNVVPIRSDTIRLVQNGCLFHGLRSEDPIQPLKDFLRIIDSIDLNGDTRNSTRLRLFHFSLHDQAIIWLDRLFVGSISTWDDLTTRFLAQFFPPGRTAKLRNNILMFQQRQDESLYDAWTRFKDSLLKVVEKLKDEIMAEENRVKKIEKITSCPSLDIILGEERDPKPPIKPHSPDSFRMKVVDKSTINTPPSPHVASFHLTDLYCYYHPCIDDPKKHYGFKPGLLGHGGSLGVDFLKLEMTEDDCLGEGLSLPIRPKVVGKVRIKDSHQLEHIFQPLFQYKALSYYNGVYRYYHPHLTLSVGEPSPLLNKGRVRLVTQTKTSASREVLFDLPNVDVLDEVEPDIH
ncbi:zinc finger, CCHC-type containing protein, partial [Tanacetum coccineum]